MLRLRPYKKCDAEYIVKWISDEYSFRQWSADRFESYPLTAEQLNEYYTQFEDNHTNWQMTAFDENGIPVGHFIMRFLDEAMTTVRLGFVIVDHAFRGKGYGKEMISLATQYAFDLLKVNKITLGVFTNNESAYHCYRVSGFKEVRTDHKAFLMGEDYWPCIEMELTK